MANLNLSEFTEKLFVADADHTFIWDSAVSISKRVSRNSWLNSGTLTSDAPVTISQTWDSLAVAFTAFKVNATSTNSAATSLFLDLQVGGGSKFKIGKDGSAYLQPYNGFSVYLRQTSNTYNLGIGLTNVVGGYGDVGLFQSGSGGLGPGWDVNNFAGRYSINGDTVLTRDAPNTLALRNGAAAQTFRVYNTYTDASNYERATFSWSLNQLNIGVDYSGSGVARKLGIVGAGIDFNHAGVGTRMSISTAGNVGIGTTAPGAKLDILASGSNDGISITNSNTISSSRVTLINNTGQSAHFSSYSSGIGFGLANSAGFGGQNSLVFSCDSNVSTGGTNSIQFRAGGFEANQERMRITAAGNVGIGTTSPTSKLQVSAGDVEVDTIAKGVILKSPDGTRYRVTVANGGTLSVAAV